MLVAATAAFVLCVPGSHADDSMWLSFATNRAVELQWRAGRGAVYQVESAGLLATGGGQSTPWRLRTSRYTTTSPTAWWRDEGDPNAIPPIPHPEQAGSRFYRVSTIDTNSPSTVYLDAVHGDDLSATVGDSQHPFQTWTAAIHAVASDTKLVVRPGLYRVATQPPEPGYPYGSVAVLENKHNIWIEGNGAVLQAEGLGNILRVAGGANINISGLEFTGPGPYDNTNGPVVYFALLEFNGEVYDATISHCRFIGSGDHGIGYLYGNGYRRFHRGTIAFNYFERCGQRNVARLGGDGAAIACTGTDNLYMGNLIVDCHRGIELEGRGDVRRNRIIGNSFRGVWCEAISLLNTGQTDGTFVGNVIQDNLIRGPGRSHYPGPVANYPFGILWGGGEHGIVSGNWIVGMPDGGGITVNTAFSSVHDLIISGNHVHDVGQRCIDVVNVGTGHECYRVSVRNNTCVKTASANPGIRVAGDRITVSGNYVGLAAGDGIQVTTVVAPSDSIVVSQNQVFDYGRSGDGYYGINIASGGISNLTLWGNVASEHSSGRLQDRGTATRKTHAFAE